MTPGAQQKLLLRTCILVGCFVAPASYVPLLLASLEDPEAPVQLTLSRLQVLRALLQGSGEHQMAGVEELLRSMGQAGFAAHSVLRGDCWSAAAHAGCLLIQTLRIPHACV